MNPYVPAEWRQGEHLQALYREFCVKTTGQHSPALQRLINWLRSDPMQGKLALLCTVPHKEWQLVRMNGRGLPMSRLEETYHDIDDAERAIFRHRVRARLRYPPPAAGPGRAAPPRPPRRPCRVPVPPVSCRKPAMLHITAYVDQVSVCPGQTVQLMVHCEYPSYQVEVVKVVHGDTSPAAPQLKILPTDGIRRELPGRPQRILAGSFGLVERMPAWSPGRSLTFQAFICPTTPGKGRQAIISRVR